MRTSLDKVKVVALTRPWRRAGKCKETRCTESPKWKVTVGRTSMEVCDKHVAPWRKKGGK